MKTSIISLLPPHQNAAISPIRLRSLKQSVSVRLLAWRRGGRSDAATRGLMEPAVPALRILRPKNGKDGLFDYAIGANDSRWDTFVFASLALSAVTALVIALEALIGG